MQLRAEIEVEATPGKVWKVLTDVERLHEWNPFFTHMDGSLNRGKLVRVHVSLPGGRDRRIRAEVLTAEPGVELRLGGTIGAGWLLRGQHFAQLIALADGRTRVVHGQDFDGLLVRLAPHTMTQAARGLTLLNTALKRRLDSLHLPKD